LIHINPEYPDRLISIFKILSKSLFQPAPQFFGKLSLQRFQLIGYTEIAGLRNP